MSHEIWTDVKFQDKVEEILSDHEDCRWLEQDLKNESYERNIRDIRNETENLDKRLREKISDAQVLYNERQHENDQLRRAHNRRKHDIRDLRNTFRYHEGECQIQESQRKREIQELRGIVRRQKEEVRELKGLVGVLDTRIATLLDVLNEQSLRSLPPLRDAPPPPYSR